MKKFYSFLLLFFIACAGPVFGLGEIEIQNVHYQDKPPFQYIVQGRIVNHTAEDREVVLRAEIVIYDQTVPKGDLPVRVLRKDMTIILKGNEQRDVEMPVMLEGRMPDVRYRVEPFLRTRRQRLWIFPYEDLKQKNSQNTK